MKRFKSVFEIPPIGFRSALEQLHHDFSSGLETVQDEAMRVSLVFGQIASQTLVNVGAAQHEQPANLSPCPWQKLSEQVPDNHSQTSLLSVSALLSSNGGEASAYLDVL